MIRLSLLLLASTLFACAHYRDPQVITIQTGPHSSQDVAWVIQSDKRILRCVGSTAKPLCKRAHID